MKKSVPERLFCDIITLGYYTFGMKVPAPRPFLSRAAQAFKKGGPGGGTSSRTRKGLGEERPQKRGSGRKAPTEVEVFASLPLANFPPFNEGRETKRYNGGN